MCLVGILLLDGAGILEVLGMGIRLPVVLSPGPLGDAWAGDFDETGADVLRDPAVGSGETASLPATVR